MHSLINKIQSKIKSNIFLDYDMRKSTWFRAGGNALGYVIVNSISCLLYTSPSPRDRTRSRMPSSA